MADLMYFLFYYVVKYRYKVIYKNLKNAFPEKNEKEIQILVKGAYRNLCDILVEGIKSISQSCESISKRYIFRNPELVDAYTQKGQAVLTMAPHYTNWEWSLKGVALQTKDYSVAFYKPLSNPFVNEFMFSKRIEESIFLESIFETQKVIDKHCDKPINFVMITDQSPSNIKKADWVTFLNQDTACLHGADRIARERGFPVFYAVPRRIRRGYYEVFFSPICEDGSKTETGEITAMFFKKLEETIREKPEDWLWSHKRWKHQREVA